MMPHQAACQDGYKDHAISKVHAWMTLIYFTDVFYFLFLFALMGLLYLFMLIFY